MIYQTDLKETLQNAFLDYAGSVAQERAIADVRDGLKIGLRRGLYAQYTNKLTHDNKFQKAQKSVAAAMAQSYVSGDASMYDTFIRAAKPFAYRYPLEEAQGAYGTQCSPDDHSAPRYVEMRSSALADYLFAGLKKNAIGDAYYWNYDDTELIPYVFPSIGFWNVINGCTGIAVSFATSVPQFNLREVNNALITLIHNPDASFDTIYCAPDFATGGIITNAKETKDSVRKGEGGSIALKAVLEYFPKERMIKATGLPYGVYTNTVITQLKNLTDNDENYGIERVIDYTKKTADIRIYLSKNADPKKMMKKLYKDTSLSSRFMVNMMMLDNGCFPRVFGWRDALMAYITHIRECKKREIQFDLDRALSRENVLNGLIQACAHIDEIMAIIRASDSPAIASERLIARFQFNEEQTKAILAMKLSSLTRMDADKLCEELAEIQREIGKCRGLINSPKDLDEELVKALREVADKFGDDRRTQILEQEEPEEEEEDMPVEQDITVYLLDDHTYIWRATNSKRALKLPNGVGVVEEIETTSANRLLIFTKDGTFGTMPITESKENEPIIVPFMNPVFCCVASRLTPFSTILFTTKNGMVKKSDAGLYLETRSRKPITAIKLKEDDSVIGVHILTRVDDYVFIRSATHYVCFSAAPISSTGRAAAGVRAIKLKENEVVVSSEIGELMSCPYTITSMNVRGEKIV